jgi:hypothetical protein
MADHRLTSGWCALPSCHLLAVKSPVVMAERRTGDVASPEGQQLASAGPFWASQPARLPLVGLGRTRRAVRPNEFSALCP